MTNELIRERERAGEDDVDAARAHHLFAARSHRLSAEEPEGIDAIRADVHQGAAVEGGVEPCISRAALLGQREAERGAHDPEAADRA